MASVQSEREEQDLDRLLTEHYNYLVRHISTRDFIPHLISENVFTTEDKELIQSKVTSVDRAGELIDIVKMRGFKGMREFMLILEYDVPSAFFKVTKSRPRDPPKEWVGLMRPTLSMRKRRSRESMCQVTQLIAHLMNEITSQKQAVDLLMGKMNDVKTLQTETEQEQEKGWRDYDRDINDLEDRCATLSRELVDCKKETEELKVRNELLQAENEKYLALHTEDRARLTAFQERYDELHKEFEIKTSRKSQYRRGETTSVQKLQEEIERLTELLQTNTRKQDEDRMERLQRHVNELSQRNAEFNTDMIAAQEQRDKTLKDLKLAEGRIQQQLSEIESLKEENATHHKRNDDLNKRMGELERENYKDYWRYREGLRTRGSQPPTPTTPNPQGSPTSPNPEAALKLLNSGFKPFAFK